MGDDPLKVDKATVAYRFADSPETRCAMCAHYEPGEYTDGAGECGMVAGPIRVDATCDRNMPATPVALSVDGYSVVKSDDSAHTVYGWAYVTHRADGSQVVDHSGETIDLDELERAATDFVLHSRGSGEDHTEGISGELVEAFMVTDLKLSAMTMDPENGQPDDAAFEAVRKALPRGLWLGFYIPDDDAYERAKSSKSAFSIEGTAVREPVT